MSNPILLAIVLVMALVKCHEQGVPNPWLDGNFIEAVRNDEQLPWRMQQGCKDLDRVKVIAQMAELNKPVVLKSDAQGTQQKWFTQPEMGKTPLARARAKGNKEIINMLQALGAQK